MYQKSSHSGSSPEFWEENWDDNGLGQSLKFCSVDPLRLLFEKYAKPGMTMLEGGCGMGQYVTYYTRRGVKVVGLDFAQRALKRLNNQVKGLRLCAGDVSRLPFADESFDVYYSGGVVEHFEDGAEDSLKEARRVLKKEGVLLISVPYFSPLRQILFPLKNNLWKKTERSEKDPATSNGKRFFQYAYTAREFERLLSESGLNVVEKQGYAVLWGLFELPFMKSENKRAQASGTTTYNSKLPISSIDKASPQEKSSLIKRLIVQEDSTVSVLGFGVQFMRWFSANMMMYVCKKM